MKRFLILLLAAAMLCTFTVSAFADQEQASLYRSLLVGYYGTVTRDGNFRAAADEDSSLNGRAYQGESYLILGFAKNYNTGKYWYLVDMTGMGYFSWISAALVDVDMNNPGCPEGEGYCIVKASGGKARSGAGQDYSQKAIVTKGNGFMVYESRTASNGKTWYRISVEGISCWISSGLCDFYSYDE